ncbi:hypothetical protein OH76DRAFT_1524771 [Lentinus brumalis]|uniref:Uncharacterized protein n=1 Tax=Lentinus brumalis TaxID=2498619 RepID=A0A371DSK3_9APHY|nr:hypothetical protein OH76DRAFT_1524771 [Polyporus brumalis]
MLAVPRVIIPPPRQPLHLLLFARWKETKLPSRGRDRGEQRHVYTLAVIPDEPITTGKRVKILAVTPIAHCSPQTPPDQLDTYEPHIVGSVVGVKKTKEGRFRARIANTCSGNAVVEVELEFPNLTEARRRIGRRPPPGAKEAGSKGWTCNDDELATLACLRPWPVQEECQGTRCCLAPGPSEFMYI